MLSCEKLKDTLKIVDFHNNPICEDSTYRFLVINTCTNLEQLDGHWIQSFMRDAMKECKVEYDLDSIIDYTH